MLFRVCGNSSHGTTPCDCVLQYAQRLLFRGAEKVLFQLKTVTFLNLLLGNKADSSAEKATIIPWHTNLFIDTRYAQKHLCPDSRPLTYGVKNRQPQESVRLLLRRVVTQPIRASSGRDRGSSHSNTGLFVCVRS